MGLRCSRQRRCYGCRTILGLLVGECCAGNDRDTGDSAENEVSKRKVLHFGYEP